MKQLLLTAVSLAVVSASFGQFKKLIVEEVANNGLVPGKTYRIYAELTHPEDHVHAVYGDAENPMSIQCDKPFYQHPDGGGLSREILRKDLQNDEKLKFDSWFTLGLEDNYVNQVNQFKMDTDLMTFEEGNGFETTDGIWYATPDNAQVFARSQNRVLLMQLTTDGKVEGVINLQGRTVGHYADGRVFDTKEIADTERRRIGQSLKAGREQVEKFEAEIRALRAQTGGTDDEKSARQKKMNELQQQLGSVRQKLLEHQEAEKKSGGDVWKANAVTFTCGG